MSSSRKGWSRQRKPSRPASPAGKEQAPRPPEKAGGGAKRVVLLGSAVLVLAAAAYFLRDAGEPAAPGKPAPGTEPGRIRFENRQPASGVDFVLNNGTTQDKPVIDSTLGGVAVFDYNNDGRLDIYFTNGAHIPSLKKTSPSFHNRLYENRGDGTFADVTAPAGRLLMGQESKRAACRSQSAQRSHGRSRRSRSLGHHSRPTAHSRIGESL